MRKLTIVCGLALAAAPLLAPGLSTGGVPGARYVAISAARAADEPKAGEPKEATPEELAEHAYAALEKNCASCHGAGKRQNKAAAVDRDSYAKLMEQDVVVPGKPQESSLYTLMLDKENPMPPKRVPQKPTAEEIEAIRLWIEKGAPAPKAEAPAQAEQPQG